MEAVQKSGRKPIEIKSMKTDAGKDEKKLVLNYRKYEEQLPNSIIDELDSLAKDYMWIKQVKTTLEQLRIHPEATSSETILRLQEQRGPARAHVHDSAPCHLAQGKVEQQWLNN